MQARFVSFEPPSSAGGELGLPYCCKASQIGADRQKSSGTLIELAPLRCRLVPSANTHCGLATAFDAHMEHVCRNVDVVTRPGRFAVLELITGPYLDLAADHVERSFMTLMNVGTGSLASPAHLPRTYP